MFLFAKPLLVSSSFRVIATVAALLALVVLSPATTSAQDPDIIRGRVTGPDSLPVEGASVSVTAIASGVNKTTRTDKDGRFTVTFPSAEGDYWVAVQAIGLAARRFEIKRLADEDVLLADVRLAKAADDSRRRCASRGSDRLRRETKTARTSPAPNAPSARRISISRRSATSRRSPSQLPGVTLIPSADGGPAGFSVFGLDAAANSFTLNGLAMNGSTLPRDAAVSTTVATSPYDVSRGGFSGGQVTTRSQSGGNYIVRTMSLTGITPQMQWSDRAAQSLALEATNASVSGRVVRPDQVQSRLLQRRLSVRRQRPRPAHAARHRRGRTRGGRHLAGFGRLACATRSTPPDCRTRSPTSRPPTSRSAARSSARSTSRRTRRRATRST